MAVKTEVEKETGVKEEVVTPTADDDSFGMDGDDIFDGIMDNADQNVSDVFKTESGGDNEDKTGEKGAAGIDADDDKTEAGKEEDNQENAGNDDSGDNVPGSQHDSLDPESVMAKLEELERVNKGLLGTISAEREKRQSVESRLQRVDDYLTQIQTDRQLSQQQKDNLTAEAEAERAALQLEYDDDDNPVIPMDKLIEQVEQRLLGRLEQKITPLQQELLDTKTQTAAQAAQATMQQTVDKVISANESYPEAMNKLVDEWNWINEKFGAHVAMTGKNPQSIPEIYEEMYAAGIDEMFRQQFPDSDMDVVVDAFTSSSPVVVSRKLRKALDMHAVSNNSGKGNNATAEATKKAFQRTKKLSSNTPFMAVPSQERKSTPLEEVAEMDPEDFMSISDTDVERIKRMLAKEA